MVDQQKSMRMKLPQIKVKALVKGGKSNVMGSTIFNSYIDHTRLNRRCN